MMSSPREARSVVVMPAFWRRAWKAAIASGPEVQAGQCVGVAAAVVDAGEHRVFETYAALSREIVLPDQVDDLADVPGLLDGHQGSAFFGERIVQAHGQMAAALIEEQFQLGQYADRREGYAFGTPAQPPVGGDDFQGGGHLRPVVERLAHAHEDGVGQVVRLIDAQQLGDDLPGGKLAVEAAAPRHAEAAVHLAADLGGDAGGRTRQTALRAVFVLGNHHGLDVLFGQGGGEEILAGAVFRRVHGGGLQASDFIVFSESGAGGFGQVGHLVDVLHALAVEPLGDLFRGKGGKSQPRSHLL